MLKIKHCQKPLGLALAFSFLCGCQVTQDVSVRDVAPAYSAVAIVRPDALTYGRHAQGGFALGYERYRGRDAQTLEASGIAQTTQVYYYDNGVLISPQDVRHTVSLDNTYLTYRHLLTFSPRFQLEAEGGLLFSAAQLKTYGELSGQPYEFLRQARDFGGTLGITPRLTLNRHAAVESRFTANVAADSLDLGVNVSLVLRANRQLAAKLGYYSRGFEIERPASASGGTQGMISGKMKGDLKGAQATLQYEF